MHTEYFGKSIDGVTGVSAKNIASGRFGLI
jgi:hypothetical protein